MRTSKLRELKTRYIKEDEVTFDYVVPNSMHREFERMLHDYFANVTYVVKEDGKNTTYLFKLDSDIAKMFQRIQAKHK